MVIYFLQFSVNSTLLFLNRVKVKLYQHCHTLHLIRDKVMNSTIVLSKLIISLLLFHLKIMVNVSIIMHKSERIYQVVQIVLRLTGSQKGHLHERRTEQERKKAPWLSWLSL